MKNIPTKNTGDTWSADDENLGATGELKSLVTKTGQTLDENDLFQVTKAIVKLAGGQVNGIFYTDTGTIDNHVLNYTGTLNGFVATSAYEDGLTVKFVSNFTNDGSIINTINLQGLGAIDILDTDKGLIIKQGSLVTCVYYNGVFYVDSQSQSGNPESYTSDDLKKRGVLTKSSDWENNSTLILTTEFKTTTGKNITLKDGMKITVNMGVLEWDWQSAKNPVLDVDGTGGKTIYNKWAYSRNGFTDFDRNTISRGENAFTYNASLNAWLWEAVDEDRSGRINDEGGYTAIAGYLPLNGYIFTNGATRADYPLADTYGVFATDTQTINMADTSLAGIGGETPNNGIHQGQIENITGSTGSVQPYFQSAKTEGVLSTSDCLTSFPFGFVETEMIEHCKELNFDASTVVNTGNQTLTKRKGVYWQYKL